MLNVQNQYINWVKQPLTNPLDLYIGTYNEYFLFIIICVPL